MEDFISDIYNDAFIIENLKEFVSLSDSCHPLAARELFNTNSRDLEALLIRLAKQDTNMAVHIQNVALKVKESFEDSVQAKGLIQSQLIPALYSYIGRLTGIDVSEKKYRLSSSKTGFLTLYDRDINLCLHNAYDPMWEAYEIARSVYNYDHDFFLIFGCGLGYLAYRIYKLSFGSTKIYIYEDDTDVIEYAYHYGVLSLIPEENIEIVNNNDMNVLADRFLNDLNSCQPGGFYFAPWKKAQYNALGNNELNRININNDLNHEISELSTVNLRMNRKRMHFSLEEITDRFQYSEWIIVSAGPSLDDSIDFIRDNKGIRGIIAVNTVLRRLLNEGIIPDIVVAADQSNDLKNHIYGIEEATENLPLVADWLLNWQFTGLYKGPICFVRTNASATLTKALYPDEPVRDINGTVSCLGIEVAAIQDADRIYLAGQDLAFPNGRKYAKNMPHPEAPDAKWEMQVKSVDGGMVNTCEAFDWFRKSLEYQIARYDRIEFINLSKHGAYIKGTKSKSE